MGLRWYQQEAHDAAIDWVRSSIEPCLIEAPTGAGKSHIIAALAASLHKMSGGKHVMCLAPNSKLVKQNRKKYLETGKPASVYSASAGMKCLKHPVVFGTPGTVVGPAKKLGQRFCAVVLDEAHGITPVVLRIIDGMREGNPNLRVIGLSATPYRMKEGYIYRFDVAGKPMSQSIDPYFMKLVYKIRAHKLLEDGFLTRPVIGGIGADHYDTLALNVHKKDEIDRAFVGHGRKTAAIVADVVAQSATRNGVMLFAATVQHAKEIMASLPTSMSAIVTGEQSGAECDAIYARFESRSIKYLVSVGKLTTGFDAPHVDVIAILRVTDSVGLLQQIIGRGLRICEGKEDCLVLDYGENLERHCPDGDVFSPEVKVSLPGTGSGMIVCTCPDCNTEQEFSARKNDEGFEISEDGYFMDLEGQRIETDHGPMPAHYGRRCQGFIPVRGGTLDQCNYRWTSKKCPHCDADNDIGARYCKPCGAELVDPNEKLIIEEKRRRRDPTIMQTEPVISWTVRPVVTGKGKECIRADYVTPNRQFSIWYHPTIRGGQLLAEYSQFLEATKGGNEMPKTVTYRKNPDTNFYNIYGYDRPADEILSRS